MAPPPWSNLFQCWFVILSKHAMLNINFFMVITLILTLMQYCLAHFGIMVLHIEHQLVFGWYTIVLKACPYSTAQAPLLSFWSRNWRRCGSGVGDAL